jgi:hypothetical protein
MKSKTEILPKANKSKNTIYENFFGEKKVELKLRNPDGLTKKLNDRNEKMGPIYIDISAGRLYEAWDESF